MDYINCEPIGSNYIYLCIPCGQKCRPIQESFQTHRLCSCVYEWPVILSSYCPMKLCGPTNSYSAHFVKLGTSNLTFRSRQIRGFTVLCTRMVGSWPGPRGVLEMAVRNPFLYEKSIAQPLDCHYMG
jgi:hypothetical protein